MLHKQVMSLVTDVQYLSQKPQINQLFCPLNAILVPFKATPNRPAGARVTSPAQG